MKFAKVTALAAVAAMAVGGSQVWAQTDSDTSGLSIDINTTITVTARQANVYLGIWPTGVTADFPSDGALASGFDIVGSMLDWDISATYADLTGPGTDLVVAGAAGFDICVEYLTGAVVAGCDQAGDGTVTVDDLDHGGDASAWVGYSVDITAGQTPGFYSNAAAVTLTADLLLGTNG